MVFKKVCIPNTVLSFSITIPLAVVGVSMFPAVI